MNQILHSFILLLTSIYILRDNLVHYIRAGKFDRAYSVKYREPFSTVDSTCEFSEFVDAHKRKVGASNRYLASTRPFSLSRVAPFKYTFQISPELSPHVSKLCKR